MPLQMRKIMQDPMDGKGEQRYSDKVRTATDSAKTNDVDSFDRMGAPGQPAAHFAPDPVSVISNYTRLGEALRTSAKFQEIALEIANVAEMAESTVMQEAGDWFDKHTITRNMKELKGHSKNFTKLAEEMDAMHQRAEALYDDMGSVLTRYFEIAGHEPEDQTTPPEEKPEVGVAQDIVATSDEYDDEEETKRQEEHVNPMHMDGPPIGSPPGPVKNEDEAVERLVDTVMGRLLQKERGEPSEFRARRTMRTPKAFTRPHNGMTRDQAMDILKNSGASSRTEAKLALVREMKRRMMG